MKIELAIPDEKISDVADALRLASTLEIDAPTDPEQLIKLCIRQWIATVTKQAETNEATKADATNYMDGLVT